MNLGSLDTVPVTLPITAEVSSPSVCPSKLHILVTELAHAKVNCLDLDPFY